MFSFPLFFFSSVTIHNSLLIHFLLSPALSFSQLANLFLLSTTFSFTTYSFPTVYYVCLISTVPSFHSSLVSLSPFRSLITTKTITPPYIPLHILQHVKKTLGWLVSEYHIYGDTLWRQQRRLKRYMNLSVVCEGAKRSINTSIRRRTQWPSVPFTLILAPCQ